MSEVITVRAKALGYYGNQRRRSGQTFTLSAPKEYSVNWMEPADEASKAILVKAGVLKAAEPRK